MLSSVLLFTQSCGVAKSRNFKVYIKLTIKLLNMNPANFPFSLIVLIFVISLSISLIVNYLLLKKESPINCISEFEQIRWATNLKPKFGGYTFFITFLLVCIFAVIAQGVYAYLVIALTIAFIFGFFDDNLFTSSSTKVIGQLMVSACFILGGAIIQISDYIILNVFFTSIWIVGVMNSINMLDNMDGIVTSVSIITLGIALMIIAQSGVINLTDVILIAGIIGALIGFLFYNWNPAKIYMGDTGSQFLGAFLAWVSIQYFWTFRNGLEGGFQVRQFLIPALAFMVPLIDTTTVTFRRLARKVSPFVGGRDHTTHHLAYLGISDKNVVRIMIAISLSAVFVIYQIIDDLKTNQWNFYKTLAVAIYYLTIFCVIQYFYEVAKRRINSTNIIEKQEVATT
jgi:UDP-GlcNAc:undecaprenyl-phosphate/decaprenyl-phosphate GlcNAc-1-phosphate transferase